MFFREKKSKNSKQPILQLVENIRTVKGPRQKLVVSLGTLIKIPKENRSEVARIVKERLTGEQSLFAENSELVGYADKIVKKIQTEGKWHSAREIVCKQQDNLTEKTIAEVFIDDIQHGHDRETGTVLIGHTFWERLHFPDILRDCGFTESQIRNAEISILNRLIAQDSENAILSWMDTVAIDDILGINTKKFGNDRFYRISDKLLKNSEHIEESLYQREQTLFNLKNTIFLYDLTNTYFEGVCANNPKAEYNANQKEKRTDCPQVVVALVIDQEGFIRRHKIFNGKMTDVKSLDKILIELKKEFLNQPMPTIIFDRGMVSEENMELIKSYEDLKYIIACRSNEESAFIKNFRNEEFSLLEGRSEKAPRVEILLKEVDKTAYLLCKSEGRMEKEKAIRNKIEKKLEEDLHNLSKQIINGRENNPVQIERRIGRINQKHSKVAKYYKIEYQHREFSFTISCEEGVPKRLINSLKILKEKADSNKISFPAIKKKLLDYEAKYSVEYSKIQFDLKEPVLTWNTVDELESKERTMDGNYLLKTNRLDLDQHEIWHLYMMLTRVENAFKDLKSHLGLRPNFHQIEDRVDGHIFISILAYHLLHAIEYTLRQKGDHSRWATIKRLVSTHRYTTTQLPTVQGPVINIRKPGIPEGIHMDIYQKLKVDYKNLKVTKTIA